MVVLFHAFPTVIPGGFIGVDVFFVISGYLITQILLADFDRTKISVVRFYSRRIKRIFPALLIVLLTTLVCGWFFLFPPEYVQLGKHAVGGIAFVSNILLWQEVGYFDKLAINKPLLHLWSLGIEEQFYLFWPIFLMFILKIKRKGAIFAIFSLLIFSSFAANIFYSLGNPSAEFYSPVSRAWELLVGALLVYGERAGSTLAIPRLRVALGKCNFLFPIVGLSLLIGATLFYGHGADFPGWRGLLPVFATALILGSNPLTFVGKYVFRNPALVWLGLISYPLYLWHWPVFYFKRFYFPGSDTTSGALAILLSLALAWLTYKFIERPIRFGAFWFRHRVIFLICCAFILMGLSGYVVLREGFPDRAVNEHVSDLLGALNWPYMSTNGCENVYGGIQTSFDPFCVTNSNHPSVFLLGDSHANQLIAGLFNKFPVISAGNGAPTDDLLVRHANVPAEVRNVDLLEHAKSFLLKQRGEIKVVIIAAWWDALTNGHPYNEEYAKGVGLITLNPLRAEEAGLSQSDLLERSLERTIAYVEKVGAKSILVIDPPEINFDVTECVRHIPGITLKCPESIDRKTIDERQKIIRKVFANIKAKNPNVTIFDPTDLFCDNQSCFYFDKNHVPLYRDFTHISQAGSELIASRLASEIARLLAQ